MTANTDGALVLFSGGQDSATCLAWALDRYSHVETVGFAYGQRHAIELECREPLRLGISGLAGWGGRLGADRLPNTFVPGRNLLFLTYAAAIAYRRDLRRIVLGVCETDYSGYPDCRDDTVKAMQLALNLGMQRRFVLETPLMWRDKAATWALADRLGGPPLVELIRTASHSCYLGNRSVLHAWGYGCGTCPACDLRRAGFERWVS
jgi:7-cyano-7-deazaguanine synthase